MSAPSLSREGFFLNKMFPTLPWVMSAGLHFAILWQYLAVPTTREIPLGQWVELAPTGSFAPQKKAQPTPISPLNHAEEFSRPETAPSNAQPETRVGNAAHSSGLTGNLGDPNGTIATARERYLYELEAFINQHKAYPLRARHLGLEGLVEVAFHVQGDGTISDPHVVRPCIHDLLNRSAVELVASTRKFRPIPAELGLSVLHVTVPIQYELN